MSGDLGNIRRFTLTLAGNTAPAGKGDLSKITWRRWNGSAWRQS